MTAQIRLDQWLLDVEYSYESGDDYYSSGWIDLSVISGTISLEDSHGCDTEGTHKCIAMTEDDCYCVQRLFGKQIEDKLTEELRDEC